MTSRCYDAGLKAAREGRRRYYPLDLKDGRCLEEWFCGFDSVSLSELRNARTARKKHADD